MQDRREWIPKAHAKTFSWALKSQSESPARWSDLKSWLRQDNGIYWVTGKAGSGKSTFMKYINPDKRTRQYLEEWAYPSPLVIASFYFWNPGTSMQKSFLGLLQCLLFGVLSQRPDLIPTVFPVRWDPYTYMNTSYDRTVLELSNNFKFLSEAEFDTKSCIIIDGLDEFDGDHQGLIDAIVSMNQTSYIKVLASKPSVACFPRCFRRVSKVDAPRPNAW